MQKAIFLLVLSKEISEVKGLEIIGQFEYTPAMPSMKKSPGRNPGPINDDHHDSMRSLGFSYDNADGSRMNGKRGHREI